MGRANFNQSWTTKATVQHGSWLVKLCCSKAFRSTIVVQNWTWHNIHDTTALRCWIIRPENSNINTLEFNLGDLEHYMHPPCSTTASVTTDVCTKYSRLCRYQECLWSLDMIRFVGFSTDLRRGTGPDYPRLFCPDLASCEGISDHKYCGASTVRYIIRINYPEHNRFCTY